MVLFGVWHRPVRVCFSSVFLYRMGVLFFYPHYRKVLVGITDYALTATALSEVLVGISDPSTTAVRDAWCNCRAQLKGFTVPPIAGHLLWVFLTLNSYQSDLRFALARDHYSLVCINNIIGCCVY